MDTRPSKSTSSDPENPLIPFPNSQPGHGHGQGRLDSGIDPQISLRAATAVAADEGVSKSTIDRRIKAGLLVKVNIAGKAYITIDSLERFYERARAGEFAKTRSFLKKSA